MARLRTVVGMFVLGVLLAVLAAPVFAHGGASEADLYSLQEPNSHEINLQNAQ